MAEGEGEDGDEGEDGRCESEHLQLGASWQGGQNDASGRRRVSEAGRGVVETQWDGQLKLILDERPQQSGQRRHRCEGETRLALLPLLQTMRAVAHLAFL